MATITFTIIIPEIDTTARGERGVLIVVPQEIDKNLPSRGMIMAEGRINDVHIRIPLEPDGEGSHWFVADEALLKTARLTPGDTAKIELSQTKDWLDPELPADLKQAFDKDKQASEQWARVTSMARWDWVRWLEAVKLVETRQERPAKLCSMLRSGKRRPCCFNRAMMTPARTAVPY